MKIHAKKGLATFLSRSGAFCILLALTLTACENNSGEIETADGAENPEGMNDAYDGSPMMTVSIIESGEMVPTIPAGPTTFTVENADTEDCDLMLIPTTRAGISSPGTVNEGQIGEDDFDGETGQDPGATPGEDDGIGEESSQDASDTDSASAADRTEARQDVSMQGQRSQRVAAGQAKTVTMDLMPGLYEVSCTGDGEMSPQGMRESDETREGQTQQRTNQIDQSDRSSPMLVMVSDETTLGAGSRGAYGAPQSAEPSDPDAVENN